MTEETTETARRSLKAYLRPYDVNSMNRVRLGHRGDGGYIVPEELVGQFSHCVTYGVANDISFENDLRSKNSSCRFSLYDGTVNGLPGGSSGEYTFNKLNIASAGSGNTVTPAKTIADVLSKDANANILLKCDIEGCEYDDVFQTLSDDQLKHINALVIEVHWIHKNAEKCRKLLDFLSQYFILFHVHGNNCGESRPFPEEFGPDCSVPTTFECTYVNKNIASNIKPYVGELPIPSVDTPNNQSIFDYNLQFLIED